MLHSIIYYFFNNVIHKFTWKNVICIGEIGIEYQYSFVSQAARQHLSIAYKEECLMFYIWKQQGPNMLFLLIRKITYVTTTKHKPGIHLIYLTCILYEHHKHMLQNSIGLGM